MKWRWNMKSVCVYCGSSQNVPDIYFNAAEKLGSLLASQNISLIYGGANIGIMGKIADSVLAGGGKVTGIIPDSLFDIVAHKHLTELKVVKSMHERKHMMFELSDGFIAMPGGLGTLDELFEILTWSQLGFHKRPCGLLNSAGYWNKLLEFLDHAVAEKFIKDEHRDMIIVEENPEKLLERFRAFRVASISKW